MNWLLWTSTHRKKKKISSCLPCKLPSKFPGPDGMDPVLLKEITDNHREHNKHRPSFKRAEQRLITTQKWQNTKQGNGSTICSSPTSALRRTLEATNPAWIKLQSNATQVQPWDGDPLPCPTQPHHPCQLSLLRIHFQTCRAKQKHQLEGKGKGDIQSIAETHRWCLPPSVTLPRYVRAAIQLERVDKETSYRAFRIFLWLSLSYRQHLCMGTA